MAKKADPTPLFIVLDMDTATGIPEAYVCASGKEADDIITDLITEPAFTDGNEIVAPVAAEPEDLRERFLLVVPKEIYHVDIRRILSAGLKSRISNETALKRVTGRLPRRRK